MEDVAEVGKGSWSKAAEGMVGILAVQGGAAGAGSKGSSPGAWVYTQGSSGTHTPGVLAFLLDSQGKADHLAGVLGEHGSHHTSGESLVGLSQVGLPWLAVPEGLLPGEHPGMD